MLGGLEESSSVIVWSLLAPLGAVAFDRPGRAWPWFGAFVATIALSLVLAEVVRPDAADLPESFVRTFDVLNIVAVSFVAMLLLVTFARGRDAAQERVEALLLNVLPEEVAQRLQSDPSTIADHFENVSILFADVVDFTPLSSRLDAREVVGLLDRLFTSFDELVDRYEVEKIKTIGDCYMVAAGVPRHRPTTRRRSRASRSRCASARSTCLPERERLDLRLRIGISSGPVVAGVIGRRRFLYDLWGDTVNMASRMESHGTPDTIQITRSTWELLRDDFVTEPRGLVEVKGKGEVETWMLVGPQRDALGWPAAMSANVEAFDAWIRSTFVELNTDLEDLYFAQEDRANVEGVGDDLKQRILEEGRTSSARSPRRATPTRVSTRRSTCSAISACTWRRSAATS